MSLLNQILKTGISLSDCQFISFSSAFEKPSKHNALWPVYQILGPSFRSKVRNWHLNHIHRGFGPLIKFIKQTHYYVMGASHSFAPIRIVSFPPLGIPRGITALIYRNQRKGVSYDRH